MVVLKYVPPTMPSQGLTTREETTLGRRADFGTRNIFASIKLHALPPGWTSDTEGAFRGILPEELLERESIF